MARARLLPPATLKAPRARNMGDDEPDATAVEVTRVLDSQKSGGRLKREGWVEIDQAALGWAIIMTRTTRTATHPRGGRDSYQRRSSNREAARHGSHEAWRNREGTYVQAARGWTGGEKGPAGVGRQRQTKESPACVVVVVVVDFLMCVNDFVFDFPATWHDIGGFWMGRDGMWISDRSDDVSQPTSSWSHA